MRVIRSSYRDAAAWWTQRRALQEATAGGASAPELESAVVVRGPEEHSAGRGVLVEAVVADGTTIY